MELSTDDFTAEFGEELQTRHYDEILAARDAEMESLSRKALGEESYANLKKRAKRKGLKPSTLAKRIDMTPENLRKEVKKGSRFPRKAGAFDAMCRLLDFDPSKAGEVLGGIYEYDEHEQRNSEAVNAYLSTNGKLRRMRAVYLKITDPDIRAVADIAIDGLWRQLNELADSQG